MHRRDRRTGEPGQSTCCCRRSVNEASRPNNKLAQHRGREAAPHEAKAQQSSVGLRFAPEHRASQAQAPALLSHAGRCTQCTLGGELPADPRLELEHAGTGCRLPRSPQRARRVHLEARATRRERLIDRRDGKDAATAVEAGEIAREEPLPAAVADPLREQGVENDAARGREHEAPLGGRPARRIPAIGAGEIRAVAPEALRTKVIRDPARGDECEPWCEAPGELRSLAPGGAQTYRKAVAGERSARELAVVGVRLEHLVTLTAR